MDRFCVCIVQWSDGMTGLEGVSVCSSGQTG